MNKAESKYYNTACLMDEALLLLLEEKDFDYITVKEVCLKAGVNRSTFYLHYESMNDLLDESLAYIFSQFTSRYDKLSISKKELSTCPIEELFLITPQYVIPYLEFLKDNVKAFMASLSKPDTFGVKKSFSVIYQEIFLSILERFCVPETERKYLLIFYISGIHAIIIEWLKGGCKEEMEYIAKLLVRYTMKIK